MSANDGEGLFPQTGIIIPDAAELKDALGPMAYGILDDIFYNIIHDLVRDVHRNEKIARATSAAIVVEQKAALLDPNNSDSASDSATETGKKLIVETDAAKREDGKTYIKGNPLKTTTEIRCPKCKLPRLLHPTDGNGAQKPQPGVEYCKKRPFIDKPYYDIYGQIFEMEGPGRGKKKVDMVNPLKQMVKEGTPNGSQESTGDSPVPEEVISGPIKFPHAKCESCNRFFPIRRMNNHMAKCIGGSGRESSRNARYKIQNGNGNGNGSQNGFTPPTSRSGTPAPSNNNKGRSSPSKRGPSQDFDSEESPQKKKKPKKSNMLKLKAPKMTKSASQHSTSNLSFSEKPPRSDDEIEDGGDDDRDGTWGRDSISVDTKKKEKVKPTKKMSKPKATKTIPSNKPPKPDTPPNLPPEGSKVTKLKIEINGKNAIRDESESSQTLSSPN